MYNLSALRQIFYKYSAENVADFDPQAYFDLCEAEMMDYVKFAMAHANNECTPADLSSVFARFELARRADSI